MSAGYCGFHGSRFIDREHRRVMMGVDLDGEFGEPGKQVFGRCGQGVSIEAGVGPPGMHVDAALCQGYSIPLEAAEEAPSMARRRSPHESGRRSYISGPPCRIDMAGISVTLEGNNIQLAFEKNDHTTAVVMDPGTAQSLVLALGQLLLKLDSEDDEEGEAFGDDEFLDVTSPSIDV